MFKKLKQFLWVLRPAYWFQNNPFSSEWDAELLDLMEKHTFTDYDGFKAKLGGVWVWVENHPYGSFRNRPETLPFRLYKTRGTIRCATVRPRRSTIWKAMQKLIEDLSNDPK